MTGKYILKRTKTFVFGDAGLNNGKHLCGVFLFLCFFSSLDSESLLLLLYNVEQDSIIQLDSSKLDAIALGIQISSVLLVVK